MVQVVRRIAVHPGSELAKTLREATVAGQVVLLEVDGQTYRLIQEVDENPWKDYDPERARIALGRSAGALFDVEREQLIKDVYEA